MVFCVLIIPMFKVSKNLAKDNALSGIFEEMAVGSATPTLPTRMVLAISCWLLAISLIEVSAARMYIYCYTKSFFPICIMIHPCTVLSSEYSSCGISRNSHGCYVITIKPICCQNVLEMVHREKI
jgi:hypothetical protein